jgi:AcrR family transcriptional regulator
MTRRDRERETRRRYILEAARGIIRERGIEETRMEDVARAAEYTRRTLYAYFRSRDDVCLAVTLDGLATRCAFQEDAMAAADTGLGKVLAWGEAFAAFATEQPHELRLQVYWDFRGIERERISDEVFAAFEAQNERFAADLREAFRLGIADGSLRGDLEPDLCISQYVHTLRIVLNKALFPGYAFAPIDAAEYVRHYLDLFVRAIRGEATCP